ncbi:glutathione S-transferase family protein [Aspergillus affinis]|uniref:glutathione S-transferase family protein n=1 Tax=Aspergillus affinis TaxID=1070780 RepID=UPI0022FE63F8|nr:glutathione S-transferase [Aspergillus affinis]KAI9043114.1 glutathione S-transferase [Aspergillus affinis]
MSSIKPLVLHAHSTGPNPIKVAIALQYLQVPYEVKQWQFGDDAENGVKGAKFLQINENGRVPALEDPNTGVVSWESGACMNYVRRVYDKAGKLGPVSNAEQDIVDFEKWEYFLLTTLGPMLGQTNWFRHYNATKNEDALERYVAQSYRCFDVLEKHLEKTSGENILPGKVTAVDYHFEPWVRQYTFAGLSLNKYPKIEKWLKGMTGREEVKQAYISIKGAAPQ